MYIHFYIFLMFARMQIFFPLNIELHNAKYFYQVKKGNLFIAIEQEIAYMLFDSVGFLPGIFSPNRDDF